MDLRLSLRNHTICFLSVVSSLLLIPVTADAELVLSGYFGWSDTPSTDVRLSRPGGTDLTFHKVGWDDESTLSPPYYGLRGTYFFEGAPEWGLGLEFIHAKMAAKLDRTVRVSGTRGGTPVDAQERLGDTFDRLEFTDGHNMLLVNGIYRWFPKGERDDTLLGRLQPYAGLGAGIAIPHAEVTVEGDETFEYQYVGFAGQGLAGVNFDIVWNISLFTEYKLTYADMKVDLDGGGTLKVEPWTHHVVLGLSYSFR